MRKFNIIDKTRHVFKIIATSLSKIRSLILRETQYLTITVVKLLEVVRNNVTINMEFVNNVFASLIGSLKIPITNRLNIVANNKKESRSNAIINIRNTFDTSKIKSRKKLILKDTAHISIYADVMAAKLRPLGDIDPRTLGDIDGWTLETWDILSS